MKPKIFVACQMLLACAGGTATLADNVVPNVGFHLTETCGPHSSGGAEGWSVARFGELKNGVWVEEHRSISSKDGLLRREKWQLRLGQSGSINFHRSGNRGSATWEGDYTGRISDNYKAINLDGVETNDGVVVRKCTLLVDFDSQPIVKELATNANLTQNNVNSRSGSPSQPTPQARSFALDTDRAVCAQALNRSRSDWDNSTLYEDHVNEAKLRNLSVDDCRLVLSETPSNPLTIAPSTITSNKISEARSFALDTDRAVCAQALNRSRSDWDNSTLYEDNVNEAKLRNLSVDDCRLALSETPSTKASAAEQLRQVLNDKAILIGYRRLANHKDGTHDTKDFNWLYNISQTLGITKKYDNFDPDTKTTKSGSSEFINGQKKQNGQQIGGSEMLEVVGQNLINHYYSDSIELYKLKINVKDNACEAQWDIIDPRPTGIKDFDIGAIQCDLVDAYIDISKNHLHPLAPKISNVSSAENDSDKTKAEQDVLIAQADVLISKSKSAAVRLTVQFDGFKKLQDSVRKEFQDNINSSIKEIEEKISTLSSAKENKANSDQINQLRSELNDLKNKKLADDPSFQSLVGKLAAVRKEAADNDAALKAQMEINNIKLDAQRVNDIKETDAKLSGLSIQMSDYQNKFEADLAAFQSGNDQRFNQIATNIDNLNARTAELEKNQKTLANNQVTLAVKQANTDARLDGIFLPKSENPPDWISRLSSIPVQQNQFCRIVDRFYDDLSNVYKLRNDIKKNALYKDRQQDMAALLPNGAINSWIVRVVEVTQAADGSAAIMLQPPCRAMLGSDACGTDQKKFRATIQPDTLMYRELARVNSGDFVTVSGTILYAQTMNTSSALPQYALYEPNKHCSAADGSKEEDVFVTEITNIAILR